jgi:hypothetical protein
VTKLVIRPAHAILARRGEEPNAAALGRGFERTSKQQTAHQEKQRMVPDRKNSQETNYSADNKDGVSAEGSAFSAQCE